MIFTPIDTNVYIPVLFVGDIHGSMRDFDRAVNMALRNGIKNILFVGDFWLYDSRELVKIHRVIERNARNFSTTHEDVNAYFIDGNHENFFQLAEYMVEDGVPYEHVYGNGNTVWEKSTRKSTVTIPRPVSFAWNRPVHICDHLHYIPRGCVLEIEGITIGCVGGAYSIDHQYRKDGVSWFSLEERINDHDVSYAIDNFSRYHNIDVFVSHEAVNHTYLNKDRMHNGVTEFTEHINSDHNLSQRAYLQQIVDSINPYACVHGHHHKAYSDFVDLHGTVESDFVNIGLGKNSEDGSFAVIPIMNTYALNNQEAQRVQLLSLGETVVE